jgi:hypothetical protein
MRGRVTDLLRALAAMAILLAATTVILLLYR